ncbi:hypothetical protein HMPREF1544_12360, partial [Mucor circinelloides 1006PhL]
MEDEQQQQQEVDIPINEFIFNNINFDNNRYGLWATAIRDHYPEDDDAESIISLLAGRYYQQTEVKYPPSPPAHPMDGSFLNAELIAELESPNISDQQRITTINDLFGLNLPLNPVADDDDVDDNSSEHSSVIIDEENV